ncbi:hypothetical protein HY933_04050 [Candidatus Falkowbacteria bacterium]|nr:hypothetical protein [Candidatus Falkowbacteria bacterium]
MDQEQKKSPQDYLNSMELWRGVAIALVLVMAIGVFFWIFSSFRISVTRVSNPGANVGSQPAAAVKASAPETDYSRVVFPADSTTLPVTWGDLGKQLVDAGVIDQAKFLALYQDRGGLSPAETALLAGTDNGHLVMTRANSAFILNLLWALGLGQQNDILDAGPMQDKKYGGAGGFASTGGWTLASGPVMEHYSKHRLFSLTPEQQKLVADVSKNIYRPCCGNSTYFPDCNHGMAMLGLLELMASQGVSEADMYKVALAVNTYWFPDTYLTIAKFLDTQGSSWSQANPKDLLSAAYSSGPGFRAIMSKVTTPVSGGSGGGGCGI